MKIIKRIFPAVLSVLLLSSIFVPPEDNSGRNIITVQNVTNRNPASDSPDPAFSPEQIMQAYQSIFTHRIKEIRKKNGDWAALIGDSWYYYADARFLPEDELENRDKYSPYPFYSYSRGTPELIILTDKQKQELKERVEQNDKNPPQRHPGFFNALWNVYDKQTSWEQVKTIRLFKREIEVHWEILEEVAAVDIFLYRESKYNSELASYINSIESVSSYNYRKISGTDSLSMHAYGLAIDIKIKNPGNKAIYWRWSRPNFENWFDIKMENRLNPPQIVIDAFEEQGFIWGGKWLFFDTIHFEYRPEILLLNEMAGS